MMAQIRDLGSKFDPFKQVDSKGPELLSFRNLAQMIAPFVSPDMVDKVRKGHALGRKHASQFAKIASHAVYSVPTSYEFFLSPQLVPRSGRYIANLATTPIPFVQTSKGPWYLCGGVHANYEKLEFDWKIPLLSLRGDSRTVVVTKHVCQQLAKRAGIKGSYVPYIAEAIFGQDGPHVQYDGDVAFLKLQALDGTAVGYCPVDSADCELKPMGHGTKYGARIFKKQLRWRLKTFRNDERLLKKLRVT